MSSSPSISRFAILVSGRGSNLQVLLDGIAQGNLCAQAVLVVSSEPGVPALARAKKAGVPAIAFPYRRDTNLDARSSRRAYDTRLADLVTSYAPDYILLLGWMRILSSAFIQRFPSKIYNLHPALPGSFPGTHGIERAWDAYARREISHSGAMIHQVPDEGVDTGPVLESERLDFIPGESLEGFEIRMHELEHRLVLRAARRLAALSGHDTPNPEGGH